MKSFREIFLDKEPISEAMGKDYVPGKSVSASQLKVGETYMYFYKNAGISRAEVFTFTGFSDADQKYGESGPVFKSIAEVKKHYNVRNAKEMEALDERPGAEYGMHVYMCGKFDGGDSGCYFYLYNGRWSRGSGADSISIYEAVKPDKESI